MNSLKKLKKIRIHREGTAILIVSAILLLGINALVLWLFDCKLLTYILAAITILIYMWMVNFFRCPIRLFGKDTEKVVVAPADGKIVVIEEVDEHEYFHDKRLMISIFMDVTNVHANWYPIEGEVLVSQHQKGRHQGAWLPKSSTENERSLVVIETPNKVQVAVRQIAGAMARRIVTYAKAGKQAHRNEHLGFIKFGSRVDMYLPLDTEIFVSVGEQVTGNETIIGRINS